jgi:predicted sulfurtransferase
MQPNRTIIIIIVAVAAAMSALWLTQRSVTPKKATWDDVLAEARSGGYRLIATRELASVYSQNYDAYLLVDTRQEWEYRTGHIAGAVSFPLEPTWWSRWRKAEALEKLLGPDKDRKVVFY